jgi:hypothetical protein
VLRLCDALPFSPPLARLASVRPVLSARMPRRTNTSTAIKSSTSTRSRKQPVMNGLAASMRAIKKKPHAYEGIAFHNVPSFAHLPSAKARATALERHEQWEQALLDEPRCFLHRSCTGLRVGHGAFPRQMLALLIAEYCFKNRVSLEAIRASITGANGDVDTPGLFTPRPRDALVVVNLHMLDDQTLLRVYNTIPEHQRARKVPAAAAAAAAAATTAAATPEPARVVEEVTTWVSCDECSKWRRLLGAAQVELPEHWVCQMHPRSLTCADPEDSMDADENCLGEQPDAVQAADGTADACATEPSGGQADAVQGVDETTDACATEPSEAADDDAGDDADVDEANLFGEEDEEPVWGEERDGDGEMADEDNEF